MPRLPSAALLSSQVLLVWQIDKARYFFAKADGSLALHDAHDFDVCRLLASPETETAPERILLAEIITRHGFIDDGHLGRASTSRLVNSRPAMSGIPIVEK